MRIINTMNLLSNTLIIIFLLNEHNTSVQLYLEYEFDNKLVELSIKPIFSGIMSSILDSFISEAFRLKNNG